MTDHLVYVISDLHLGGKPGDEHGDRGFAMCTQGAKLADFIGCLAEKPAGAPLLELVIAGDFLDFLAEEPPEGSGRWLSWQPDPDQAKIVFHRIVERNADVFRALSKFHQAGHRLTLLLGNHDLELCYPAIQRELENVLSAPGANRIRFIYDGQSYQVGDTIIEHGNRYDAFNIVDHDGLRRMRSLQSRHELMPPTWRYEPPPGSRLVAEIVNPIKNEFPFIDLLKPQGAAAVPILLALKPQVRTQLAKLAALALQKWRRHCDETGIPRHVGDAGGAPCVPPDHPEDEGLHWALDHAFHHEKQSRSGFLSHFKISNLLKNGGHEIAVMEGAVSLFHLLTGPTSATTEERENRHNALLDAVRAWADRRTFDLEYEQPSERHYLAAARRLIGSGFRNVVFGHTHLARNIDLANGKKYINSGTWADLIRLPDGVFDDDANSARQSLNEFVEAIRNKNYDKLIFRRPTFARIEQQAQETVKASVEEFQDQAV